MRNQFRSHTDSVNGLNFQLNTDFFVSGSADKTVTIWDMRTALPEQTFYGHMNTINDTVFSAEGSYVSSCDSDGIVKIWETRKVQELMTVDIGDVHAHCMAFDKSGKYVAVGCSDATIKMVSLEKGEVTQVLKSEHNDAINSVYINHDNTAMYSAGNDGKIVIWK